MNYFRKACCICAQNFRKWVTNYRIWVLFILIAIFINSYTKEISLFAEAVHYRMSPWLFPFLYGQKYMKYILFSGVLLLFCDAPFLDEEQPYVIIRSGRKFWSVGQVFYIVTASAAYFLYIVMMSILLNLGNMEWNPDWGKVLGTLGTVNVGNMVSYKISVSSKIVTFFTPLQAMWFTFLLSWLTGIFLGLLIYACNVLFANRFIGVLFAAFFVFFDTVVRNHMTLLWFSPVSWSALDNIGIGERLARPDITYVLTAYGVLILALCTIIFMKSRKQPIEVMPPI
jgi:hypothetical protein